MARQLGISVRRLDGWEPKQSTRVTEWTAAGQPAAWETTTEPEWNRRERNLMLALDVYEGQLCRKCHEHLGRATDPDTDPDRPDASQEWVSDDPVECYSCKVLTRADDRWSNDQDDKERQYRWLIHTTALVNKDPG